MLNNGIGSSKQLELAKDHEEMFRFSFFSLVCYFQGKLPKATCPCSWQGGWNRMIFKVPSSPNHSMILWYSGLSVCVVNISSVSTDREEDQVVRWKRRQVAASLGFADLHQERRGIFVTYAFNPGNVTFSTGLFNMEKQFRLCTKEILVALVCGSEGEAGKSAGNKYWNALQHPGL